MASVRIQGTEQLRPSHFQPPDFHLSPGRIDIWMAELAAEGSNYRAILSPAEQERAQRYRNALAHDQFVMGRAILRMLSAKYTGLPAETLVYTDTADSKLSWQPPADRLYFNVTHSANHVAVCFGTDTLGIDIEKLSERFAYEDILDRCFSEDEKKFIKNNPASRSLFYQYWTRKEALVKAIGSGLRDDIVNVPCTEGDHNTRFDKNWELRSFEYQSDIFLTLAFQPAEKNIRFLNFRDLSV